jgi:type II secretory pathway pseudopilin PulG
MKQRGYSIIELLTVIVGVSILASITILGYGYYIQEAKNTQTANLVSQYKDAIHQVVLEKNSSPSQQFGANTGGCLSSNTAICCLARGNSAPFCRRNSDADGTGGFSNATSVYNQVSAYVKPPLPVLPELSKAISICSSSGVGPCYTPHIGYIATTTNSSSPKGAITYYLPDTMDCQSEDVMEFDTSTVPNRYNYGSSGQKFTKRVAGSYTECVVGIR